MTFGQLFGIFINSRRDFGGIAENIDEQTRKLITIPSGKDPNSQEIVSTTAFASISNSLYTYLNIRSSFDIDDIDLHYDI